MNLIKILVKLLDKAYHAEARKHHKAADKHEAASVRHQETAKQLQQQAEANAEYAVACKACSIDSRNHALKVQAKANEVSQFFTV